MREFGAYLGVGVLTGSAGMAVVYWFLVNFIAYSIIGSVLLSVICVAVSLWALPKTLGWLLDGDEDSGIEVDIKDILKDVR